LLGVGLLFGVRVTFDEIGGVQIESDTDGSEDYFTGITYARQYGGCIHSSTLLFDCLIALADQSSASEAVEQLELGLIGGRIVDDLTAYFNPGVTEKRVCTVPDHHVGLDSHGAHDPRRNYGTLEAEQRLPVKRSDAGDCLTNGLRQSRAHD